MKSKQKSEVIVDLDSGYRWADWLSTRTRSAGSYMTQASGTLQGVRAYLVGARAGGWVLGRIS